MPSSRRSSAPVRIALTLGDPNGIGPEIAVKAARRLRRRQDLHLTLVGDAAIALEAVQRFGGPPGRLRGLHAESAEGLWIWDPHLGGRGPRLRPGQVAADAGRASADWVEAATLATLTGAYDAVVTAPIHKAAWDRAQVGAPGHTEFIANLCGVRQPGMLLQGGPLRVFLVTRHLPLRAVPDALTRATLRDGLRLLAQALPWLGAADKPIAVCGLNPHAGDGGTLGREEIEVVQPVLRVLRRQGLPVEGPFSADTVFHRAWRGDFAAVAALYHDQGLPPLKMMCLDSGVNITLGLPLVRTSPDHGTAFDRAWRGEADPASLIAALETAAALARRPNPWRTSA
jgi:4-hydroxythreonine-4-phosphate dehydrogenase